MKKGSTKKALVTSIVSTCASVTMLAGATFAWFTDTASTGVNKIQAGTLNIGLYAEDGVTSVEGETLDWKTDKEQEKILWEPGATYELETVTVKNEGNLALKYKVVITDMNGDTQLNEVIDWKINGEDINRNESKLASGKDEKLTISATMNKAAGNTYQNMLLNDIAIKVIATQDNVEKDSNGNLYDKDATYPEYSSGIQAEVTKGEDVKFGYDVAVEKDNLVSSGYGKTGLKQTGGVIDGNGKTLSVTGANGTWDSALATLGGTIKNLTIDSGYRGIFVAGAKSDVVIDNVMIDGTTFALNSDAGGGHKLIVTNSTLNGWTSYAGTHSEASFTNCNFGKSKGYAYLRPYANTTLTDCEFSAGFELDSRQVEAIGITITLKNCKVGDTLVTAGNVTDLLGVNAQYVTIEN